RLRGSGRRRRLELLRAGCLGLGRGLRRVEVARPELEARGVEREPHRLEPGPLALLRLLERRGVDRPRRESVLAEADLEEGRSDLHPVALEEDGAAGADSVDPRAAPAVEVFYDVAGSRLVGAHDGV